MSDSRKPSLARVAMAVAAASVLGLQPARGQVDRSALAAHDRSSTDAELAAVERATGSSAAVPGEVIIGLRADCNRGRFEAELARQGATVLGEIPRLRALRVEIGGRDVAEAGAALSALPDVEYAEPNAVGRAALMPSVMTSAPAAGAAGGGPPLDTWFGAQWQLHNTGQTGGIAGADIEALPAWVIRDDAPELVIAVIDSGTDYAHPELAGRLLQGFDCVDEDEDATALNPHGIWVAGLIAAKADNGFGVAGVVHECQLLPVRVLSGLNGTTFNLAQGIDYATSQGADIVNMSLINYPAAALLINALNAAAESGAILIGSAGNSGPGTANGNWPAASPVVLSIGATNAWDERAPYSATGSVLDFVAPGDGAITVSISHDDAFDVFGGTSAAAPIAVGLAALLKSYDPLLTQAQIYTLFKAGAEDQVGAPDEDTPGWDPFHGHGRLNAFRSLQALCSCAGGEVLTVSPPKLGFGAEGTWLFRLSAGVGNAGQPYLILGTLSGTRPGFTLGQTEWPLAFDAYTRLCLLTPPIVGGAGVLDAEGEALATLTVPAAARETLAGMTLHHAAAVYDGAASHPIASVPLVLSGAVASGVHGLPERLLFEDFEGGAPGWVIDNGVAGQWHIAPPGECGASSHRAAYNSGEPGCGFLNITSGRLISPSVALTGLPPFRIRFSSVADYSIDIGNPVRLQLVDDSAAPLATKLWFAEDFGSILEGTDSTYELVVPESSKYEGRVVHIEAVFVAPVVGEGQGWMLDDAEVWNGGAD